MSRPAQVGALVAFALCAIPPATNVGPGLVGYIVLLFVLVATTLWALQERGGPYALSRGESWAVAALFGWLIINLVRSGSRWDTALAATVLAVLAFTAAWALTRMGSSRPTGEIITTILGAVIVGSAISAWVTPLVLGQGSTGDPACRSAERPTTGWD